MIDVRYKYFPQMKYYDEMSSGLTVPFAMLSGPISYKSEFINTDKYGFRYTKYKDSYISVCDMNKLDEVNIIIGGSTVFGVGASDDDNTIASYLFKETGEAWINMGVRGGVSLTEYIHLIRFIDKANKIKNIVFFSGINDIYINQLKNKYNYYDNLFNYDNINIYGCKKNMLATFFSKFYAVSIEELINKPIKEIIFYPKYKNISSQSYILSDKQQFDLTVENFDRNFLLYSALKKELQCNFIYILQPFVDWTKKKLTIEEADVFKQLEELQKNSKWASHRSKLSLELYEKLVVAMSKISRDKNINFIDSNHYFNKDETLFVDAVHLSDAGNDTAIRLILSELGDVR